MTTDELTMATDKNCTDDAISNLPGARVSNETEPLEMFVDTPMDSHTRSDCLGTVRGWNDHEYAAVSIRVDIDAAEPLELSLDAADARELAKELLTAAAVAEGYADKWTADELAGERVDE